ncbi:MAG: hypothetical protein ABI740_09380 [Alphaproteobacteria bacterium]
MKTSLRLALSALAISFITLAAAGTPLPFLEPASPAPSAPSRLLPPDADGFAQVAIIGAPPNQGVGRQ